MFAIFSVYGRAWVTSGSDCFLPGKNLLTTRTHFYDIGCTLAETTSISNWQFVKELLKERSVLWS
jgi:hypothetical protein